MTLELDDNALLRDALKAPAGMDLSAAVGTTFTLDLTALLAIPVATSFQNADEESEEPADLLETIRRTSDRTVLFCQAGAISVPAKYRAALTFVEQTVVEIKRPPGGIFHPKWWVLRFEGAGRTHHRVLVMSRNLTFDRALDVIVRLDEDERAEGVVDVRAVVGALSDYPKAAARTPTEQQISLIEGLASSLATARLAVPDPFASGRLVAGRPGSRGQPFRKKCDHALAVSPFLTSDAVSSLVRTANNWTTVVSRRRALDAAAGALRGVDEILRVKDAVLNAQEDADTVLDDLDQNGAEDSSGTLGDPAASMRGLHAKIYVQDVSESSTTWLGSANLTHAGFGVNYEMLVELTGPVAKVGVDAVLDPGRKRRDLGMLVEPHDLVEVEDEAEEEEGLGDLEGLAYDLASKDVTLSLSEDADTWRADLAISPWSVDPDLTVSARPLTLSPDFRALTDGTASWEGLDLTAITPFVVLELRRDAKRRQVLVRAELFGDPEQRRHAVLAHAITSREDFLRYLAALLGVAFEGPAGSLGTAGDFDSGRWVGGLRAERILEDLLTTASRAPQRLATLQQTLEQIDARPDSHELVPEEFRSLWASVHAVRGQAIR